MPTDETRTIARRYFEAWTTRDTDTTRSLLDEQLHFTLGTGITVDGREAFLEGERWPEGVAVDLVSEAYDGEVAMQLYDARNGDVTLRVAERFEVCNGVIADIAFVTDMASYPAFMAGEPALLPAFPG